MDQNTSGAVTAHKRLLFQLQEENSDDEDDLLSVRLLKNPWDEEDATSTSIGSKPGNRPNLPRDFNQAVRNLQADYFGLNPVYPAELFQRRFRMPTEVFCRVYSKISALPFFTRKRDATGKEGIHPLHRPVASLHILAYGNAADGVDGYAGISKTSALASVKQFAQAIVAEFGAKYLRTPTGNDMERILRLNTVRGFPGMAGRIDCQHYEWKNCPAQLAGQYKGKGKKPTIILEGIADENLWIWYMFYGLPGSLNDLNVLDKSTTIGSILSGDFSPRMNYDIDGTSRSLLYLLKDGIHPNYPISVKTISNGGNSRIDNRYSKSQEVVRKDVERAFGVLISRWHIWPPPLRLWYKEDISFIVRACVILHKMIVEHRREDHVSNDYFDTSYEDPDASSISSETILFDLVETIPAEMEGTVRSWAEHISVRNHEVTNESENFWPRHDLIHHIWSLRSTL